MPSQQVLDKDAAEILVADKGDGLAGQVVDVPDGGVLAHEESDGDILAAPHQGNIAIGLVCNNGLDRRSKDEVRYATPDVTLKFCHFFIHLEAELEFGLTGELLHKRCPLLVQGHGWG